MHIKLAENLMLTKVTIVDSFGHCLSFGQQPLKMRQQTSSLSSQLMKSLLLDKLTDIHSWLTNWLTYWLTDWMADKPSVTVAAVSLWGLPQIRWHKHVFMAKSQIKDCKHINYLMCAHREFKDCSTSFCIIQPLKMMHTKLWAHIN